MGQDITVSSLLLSPSLRPGNGREGSRRCKGGRKGRCGCVSISSVFPLFIEDFRLLGLWAMEEVDK